PSAPQTNNAGRQPIWPSTLPWQVPPRRRACPCRQGTSADQFVRDELGAANGQTHATCWREIKLQIRGPLSLQQPAVQKAARLRDRAINRRRNGVDSSRPTIITRGALVVEGSPPRDPSIRDL